MCVCHNSYYAIWSWIWMSGGCSRVRPACAPSMFAPCSRVRPPRALSDMILLLLSLIFVCLLLTDCLLQPQCWLFDWARCCCFYWSGFDCAPSLRSNYIWLDRSGQSSLLLWCTMIACSINLHRNAWSLLYLCRNWCIVYRRSHGCAGELEVLCLIHF